MNFSEKDTNSNESSYMDDETINQLYPNIFLVKLFPEIIIKSHSVRLSMIKTLNTNIRNVLKHFGVQCKIQSKWDKLMVKCDKHLELDRLIEIIQNIPGIHSFLEVKCSTFTDMDDIYRQTKNLYDGKLNGKTFCVRVKRKGNHEFTSIDVEKYVGGGLNQNVESNGVKLSNPDLQINIEIDQNQLFLIKANHPGLGGYPLSTQEDVLSLISGGFDSGVSSFKFIKRGCKVHYCFFNMGGRDHEIGVKQEAYYLWNKYGCSHRVKFYSVPFEPVIAEILENMNKHLMGVILKRMMMRVAARIAQNNKIGALVTGESVGQVSSQTITNLSVIDQVTETMILRPLIVTDKQDIIDDCRKIGTVEIAESMPEYCGVISQKPTTHAKLSDILEEEKKFNFDVIEQAIQNTICTDIKDIAKETAESVTEVTTVTSFSDNDIVIDIRSQEEIDDAPLKLSGIEILTIPFYKISTTFGDLDQSKNYLLYCKNGVMSKIQALYLKEQGYNNVNIFRVEN